MDRKWEYAFVGIGLFFLILGLSIIVIPNPPLNQNLVFFGIALPSIILSGYLFHIGKGALGDRWRIILIYSILLIFSLTFIGFRLGPFFNPVILVIGPLVMVILVIKLNTVFHLTWKAIPSPPQEREILVGCPFEETLALCHDAIDLLPVGSILQEDAGAGTIQAEAKKYLVTSVIILSLTGQDPVKTKVTVSSMTSGWSMIPDLIEEWNREYTDTICNFLLGSCRKEEAVTGSPFPAELTDGSGGETLPRG